MLATTPPSAPPVTAELPSAGRAQELLRVLAGPEAVLRPAQAAAIDALVAGRRRALVVQRTGFGKSAVYFIATRMRRDAGAGPTLLVSPLLALMRDQVAAAARMGVASATINSTNVDEWSAIETQLAADRLDLLCISPERLNHPGFARRTLPRLAAGLGLLVVDEAHCISDWGHDFRPDYRRIRDAIANLPAGTPVVATTATANSRVCTDVAEQLGVGAGDGVAGSERGGDAPGVVVLRGPLDRESLHLGVANLPSLAERLAWLAQQIPEAPGTGIVYTLTVAQTDLVAGFLRSMGVDAHAYSSETPPEERARLEAAFKANEVKALVATSALGMGVDKPDVEFVYHLGAPPSPIAYYQQVGRAGRDVERAEAWLLPGAEDRRIWDWFASVGLPEEHLVRRVLDTLGDEPVGLAELERVVDLRRSRLETLLKILDVDGAARRATADDGEAGGSGRGGGGRGWVRTGEPWVYETERVSRVRRARQEEAEAMLAYSAGGIGCLMEFLRRNLDDADAAPCGRCAPCTGADDPVVLDPAVVTAAVTHLRSVQVPVEPRKQWPRGLDEPRGNIRPELRAEEGRALCRLGDAGWGPLVETVLAADQAAPLPDELMTGIVAALGGWRWARRPAWVTWVPKSDGGGPSEAVARRIGEIGRLPVHPALIRTRAGRRQDELENSAHRCRNVWGAFAADLSRLDPQQRDGPVLVVDDVYDSGWTMTVVAATLRQAGAGAVLPLVLARR